MKIGFDQIHRPAPKWYVRLLNAFILFIGPATATAIAGLPEDILSDKHKVLWGIGISYLLALLKALQYLIGEEDGAQH